MSRRPAWARGTLGMFHWSATEELPKISVPFLAIVGDEDTTMLPRAARRCRRGCREGGCRWSLGRHYSLLERNTQVDEAIAGAAEKALPSPSQP